MGSERERERFGKNWTKEGGRHIHAKFEEKKL